MDDQQPDRARASASPSSSTPGGAAPDPAAQPGAAPGLRDQARATVGAGRRLVTAHVELAKAEFSEILDEVKRAAALVGVAVGCLVIVGFLVPIGLALFVGEALFGSLGWGVLHGALLGGGIAVAAVLGAIGYGGRTIVRDLVIAAVIGIVFGVVFGLDLTNRAWSAVGDQVFPTFSADIRPLLAGAATLAVVFGILGLLAGGRGGGMGGAIVGLLGGVVIGVVLGAFTAIAFGGRVGAALGVAIGLLAWPVVMGIGLSRRGVDVDTLKARFWPDETIETTKETIEWVREQTPLVPKS